MQRTGRNSVLVWSKQGRRGRSVGKQMGLVSHGKEFGSSFTDRAVEAFRPRDVIGPEVL